MCNLYSLTKGQQAIRDFAGALRDTTGNLPLSPGIFPDYAAKGRAFHRRRRALGITIAICFLNPFSSHRRPVER